MIRPCALPPDGRTRADDGPPRLERDPFDWTPEELLQATITARSWLFNEEET